MHTYIMNIHANATLPSVFWADLFLDSLTPSLSIAVNCFSPSVSIPLVSDPHLRSSWGFLFEKKLEVKLPTIWTDEKHSQEEAEPGRNSDVEKVRREKTEKIRDGES